MVGSWGWFYDYRYAPLTSGLKDISEMLFDFPLSTPFRPYEQLMGVLPLVNKDNIPNLMYDPNSPIIHFYPLDFELDLNAKKQDLEAIV